MRRTATFIAGAIGLLFWAFLVVAAGQSFREDPVDYDMQDLDVPDPAELVPADPAAPLIPLPVPPAG